MKERLDVLLVRQGLAASRERAREKILSGYVYVNGNKIEKAGAGIDEAAARIEVRGGEFRYVSRGGYKLAKAITAFELRLNGLVCLDIGASTGGFTDCMLQNGAARVYAVDAGVGQLAGKLREDSRVISMEKTNFRYVTQAEFTARPSFAAADVSFISLTRILPQAKEILTVQGEMVCLIKPQFEAGPGNIGKKGVVRDKSVHLEVVERMIEFSLCCGFHVCHLDFSPIKGPEGNIEYLMHLLKGDNTAVAAAINPGQTVADAHAMQFNQLLE